MFLLLAAFIENMQIQDNWLSSARHQQQVAKVQRWQQEVEYLKCSKHIRTGGLTWRTIRTSYKNANPSLKKQIADWRR